MSPNSASSSADRPIPRYASTRLIAYIGNKRALLPFLRSVFLQEAERASLGPGLSFLDPFCGSGAVSRLARCLGWRVFASDAEDYASIVTEAWAGVSSDELPYLFADEGGVAAVVDALNALHPIPPSVDRGSDSLLSSFEEPSPYMARHYAPADTKNADWRYERLFYTAENARFLDRARSAIDSLRPPLGLPSVGRRISPDERVARSERVLLLGALLYEAATHANTSGVFKAFHKGFGGHGRDALGRILSPMRLEAPELWPGPPAEVGQGDAAAFCASHPADLCYLDPPYNQHQYGSNYHILNTLAVWDRHPVSEDRGPDGRHLSIAGIPPGWVDRRSPYCSREKAADAFRGLVASIDSSVIILSYNNDGIVDPEELYDILADRAEVNLRAVDYIAYRGGRQSSSRRAATSEILFVARRRRASALVRDRETEAAERSKELSALRARTELDRLLAGAFDPAVFTEIAGGTTIRCGGPEAGAIVLRSYRGLVFEPDSRRTAATLGPEEALSLCERVRPAALPDYEAACAAAARLMEEGVFDRRLQNLALTWLRKLAHRRYEDAFRRMAARLSLLAEASPDGLCAIVTGLKAIEELFQRRLDGRHPRSGSQKGRARIDVHRASD